jgi:hypothetical protein
VIDTPVGRIGLMFGHEALYPEPARVLAYQGADMLITIAATKRPATYHKIRQGALARCQENQLYGLVSFLVGNDPFAGPDEPVFMGKSAIFAPLDFTPRFSGVMTELGSAQAEGVITAEWDYPALEELWETSETPLRRQMPLEQAGLLAQVYGRALTLDASQQPGLIAESSIEEERSEATPLLEATEEPIADESAPTEEDILSVIAPILPTEPPIIPLDEPEMDEESDEEEPETDVDAGGTEEQEPAPESEPPGSEQEAAAEEEATEEEAEAPPDEESAA